MDNTVVVNRLITKDSEERLYQAEQLIFKTMKNIDYKSILNAHCIKLTDEEYIDVMENAALRIFDFEM